MTLQLDPARSVLVWMKMCVGWEWKAKKEKDLPQVLFYVLKSCEKSTKCPYRFVFKSWFVMCSLAMFLLKHVTQVFFATKPTWFPCVYSFKQLLHEAMPQWVLSIWRAGPQYRTMYLKFADTKRCFWPVTLLFHWIREETHSKGTLVYFVKLKIWSPLSITCKKKTWCTLVWPLLHVK